MTTNDRLQALLKATEEKFGRGESAKWKNRDFIDLGFEINKEAKITISALTLKRLFGKIKTENEYLPQKATVKALEQYANFTTSGFVDLENKTGNQTPEDEKSLNNKSESDIRINRKQTRILIITGLVIIATSLYFFYTLKIKQTASNHLTGKITLLKTEGFNPKTAYFEYSTPNNKDSFKIDFDKAYPAINVPNGNNKISYYFQYPGLYKIKMWSKHKVVSDTIPLLVETKGWQSLGYYYEQKYDERFYPITLKKAEKNDYFHPSATDLHSAGMDTSRIIVVRFDNFRPTGVNGDSFTMETTVKNSDQWSGVRCNSIYLEVVGRNGLIHMSFTNPGCSYWIGCRLSEKILGDNSAEDLSGFAFDLTKWQQIRVTNNNKHIEVYINNIKRFSNSYMKTLGEIVGVSMIFHGNGYVKNYQLADKNNKPLFAY